MAWTTDEKHKSAKAVTSSTVSEGFRKAIIEQAKLPRQERKSIMVNTLKIRSNALRNNCVVLEGVVLRFNAQGIAETDEINRAVIQREMDCRQGRYSFVEENFPVIEEIAQPVVEESVVDPIEQELLNALNEEDKVEDEEKQDVPVPEEDKTTKRGRPAKKAPFKKNK